MIVFLVPGRTTASTPSRSAAFSTNLTDTSSRNSGSRSVKLAILGNLTTPTTHLPSPFPRTPLSASESSEGRVTSACGTTPITGTPEILSNSGMAVLNPSGFPRRLLNMTPLMRFLSSSGMSSMVPRA